MSSCSPHSGLGCWFWCWPRAPPSVRFQVAPCPPSVEGDFGCPLLQGAPLGTALGGALVPVVLVLWEGPSFASGFSVPDPPPSGSCSLPTWTSRRLDDDCPPSTRPPPSLGLARPVLLATLSASSSLGLLDPVSPSVGPRWARGLGGSGWVPPGSRGPWAAAWVGSVGSVGGVCGPLVRR